MHDEVKTQEETTIIGQVRHFCSRIIWLLVRNTKLGKDLQFFRKMFTLIRCTAAFVSCLISFYSKFPLQKYAQF